MSACLACPSAYMLELNHLFDLEPSVILKFIKPKRTGVRT